MPVLMGEETFTREEDAQAWLAGQRLLPECVGGRVVVITSPGLADVWLAVAVFLDRRGNRRRPVWLAMEEFARHGMKWGDGYYSEVKYEQHTGDSGATGGTVCSR